MRNRAIYGLFGLFLLLMFLVAGCKTASNSNEADVNAPLDLSNLDTSNLTVDQQIDVILALAQQGELESAEDLSEELRLQAPADPAVQRISKWVADKKRETRLNELNRKIASSDGGSPASINSGKPAASGRGQKARNVTAAKETPEILYSGEYDQEIRQVLSLARENRWEEAEAIALDLVERSPNDETLERLLSWVSQQRDVLRSQALEDKIRDIDAKNSVFNPTLLDLLNEQKDRGLPPRKDLRDAVQQIESKPYVPENYGKTIVKKGPLFSVESREGRMSKVLEKPVTLNVDDVSLESIIFQVGEAQGINFVADKSLPAFAKKLSVNMNAVKLSEFLDYVSRNLGVQFQVGEDLVWVLDGASTNRFEETRFYRLRKGFVIPAQFGVSEVDKTSVTSKGVTTVTEKQKIEKFVQDGTPDEPAIEEAIKQFFKGSEYMLDYERNLIVASGTPEQLKVMERIIEEFDRPIQQVFMEARFVTVTEAVFQQLGASWETGRGPGRSTVKDFTSLLDPDVQVGLGLEETFTSILNRDNLSLTMTALEQSGESQTLSAPRLTLLNNRPAKISDGKVQYYYEEYTVSQQVTERTTASQLVPTGKPTTVTAGVSLDVVASIGGDGQSILLALHPQVNQEVKLVTFATVTDRDAGGNIVSTFDIRLPESRTQEISTRVVVKSGQTVVMGGVLEREQLTFVESVPILGNIPLIGAAFRKRTEVDKPRYLLIFVTATILSDTGEFVIFEDE